MKRRSLNDSKKSIVEPEQGHATPQEMIEDECSLRQRVSISHGFVPPFVSGSIEEIFELLRMAEMAKPAKCFRLDLADTLSHDAKDLAGLLGSAGHVYFQRIEGRVAKVIHDFDVVALEGLLDFVDVIGAELPSCANLFDEVADYFFIVFIYDVIVKGNVFISIWYLISCNIVSYPKGVSVNCPSFLVISISTN